MNDYEEYVNMSIAGEMRYFQAKLDNLGNRPKRHIPGWAVSQPVWEFKQEILQDVLNRLEDLRDAINEQEWEGLSEETLTELAAMPEPEGIPTVEEIAKRNRSRWLASDKPLREDELERATLDRATLVQETKLFSLPITAPRGGIGYRNGPDFSTLYNQEEDEHNS